MVNFGILTVSTTCAEHPEKDLAGPKLQAEILKTFPDSHISFKKIVTDDKEEIKAILNTVADLSLCDVFFTVGGTGFAPTDVTPEATKEVIEKEATGLSYALISRSLAITETAMLSRPICGIKNRTVIINFPGSAKAACECFGFIKSSLLHAVALVTENNAVVKKDHENIQSINSGIAASGDSKVQIKAGTSRVRKSQYPLKEVAEAKTIIFDTVPVTAEIEVVSIEEAFSRVLAEDVVAATPIPPFPASMKDGYAVRCEDGTGKRTVRSVMAAGDHPDDLELQPGEVTRISTGAQVPADADAVVQVEDTTLVEATPNGEEEKIINIDVSPKPGQDIRKIGSDIQINTIVLERGNQITAAYVGVLAMLGYSTVKVVKRPCIGVISTGNELRNCKQTLKPGQIYDSNKVTLLTLLKSYGYGAVDCGIARDTPNSVKNTFESAFKTSDVIMSSGGVSMGEYDLLKQVLVEDFGATIHFGRVNMKPGKPTVFATLRYEGKLKVVFALPGNPVSCCVTTMLFVIPTLGHMEGKLRKGWPSVIVTLEHDIVNRDPRPEYVRLEIYRATNDQLLARSTGNQVSSRLNSMVNANGLLVILGQTTCKKDSRQEADLFGQLY